MTDTKKLIAILVLLLLFATPILTVAESSDVPTIVILSTEAQAYADLSVFDIIEEKCNVKIDFMFVPRDVASEKFNIMAQTDALPDLVVRSSRFISSDSEYYRLGLEGILLPMNDLIDEYAPNLKAKLESNPAYLRAATAPDGNIYVLGTDYNEYSQNFLNRTFIETSFLENLGMTMPTTLEELYDYLVAVKEKDANGNGDPDDEIPMVSLETGNDGSMFRSLIMTYFTKAGVWDNRIATDGKVEFLGATDGYRKGLEFLHKLYEEGLIYKEVFALSSNQDIWKLNEHDENVNTVGLVIGQHQRVPTNTDTTRHYSYDYLPALEGGTVAQVVQGAIQVNTCIPATCSDPAAAMRIIDYIATEEGSVLARMGVEGKDWVKAEEGYKTPSGEPAYWRYTTTEEREAMNPDGTYVFGSLGNGWPMYVPDYYWEEAINEGTTAKDVWGWYHNAYVTGFYGDALLPDENFMPSVLYYGPDMIEEISLLEINLTNALKLASTEFVTGARDIETEWDTYVNELKSMGLERYLELSQQVYDSYYGN